MFKIKGYYKEKYFNIRRAIVVIGALIIVLLLGAVYVGITSSRQMKEIICEDFNQQQLVLARYAASRMEHSLHYIQRELSLLNLSPSIQYVEKVSWARRMNITLSAVKEEGVFEIRLIDRSGKTAHIVDNRGASLVIQGDFSNADYFKWAIRKESKDRIFCCEIMGASPQYPDKLAMLLATPTYEESVDEAHPVPTGRLSGVLIFAVDITYLVKQATQEIIMGKTGYAWVVDKRGIFLYHPQRAFIGEDAFKIREMKKPKISFAKINMIQKERMLKGKEGTGRYISGWHRGIEIEMEKLIAYAPVYYRGEWSWSVAVVSPMSEVEDVIHSVYIRQFYIQGTIILVIILGCMYVIGFERRWTNALEEEVKEKTKNLAEFLEELKKSEEKYKTLVESAQDLIFTVDKNGKFLSLNRCAVNFFKDSPDNLTGKNMYDLFDEESAKLQMGFVEQVFKSGNNINVKYPVKSGNRDYWFTSNFVPLKDESGKVYASLGISRDITERRKLEEEQIYNTEKLAALGKLTACVVHELNQPIAVILGFTDILLEKIEFSTKNHEILETIERQAQNCKKIVESILGFARYPDKTEYSSNVNESLERVLSVVENILVTEKITLEKNIAKDLPKVRGDSSHLQQVFMNLITNAVAAMQGGGTLTVSTGLNSSGSKVKVVFKDTGHGIKTEYRDKVLDAFFTTKKRGEGTGLGLSVSYGIVSKYDGDIKFETVAEEEDREKMGTTFIVTLPVVPSRK
ncbi:MAG: ATP-binding protein [Desulfobacterales bacterium]|nr:ATP-binding protein [Desulfobacterales bacterium]